MLKVGIAALMIVLSAVMLHAGEINAIVSMDKTEYVSQETAEFSIFFHTPNGGTGKIALPTLVLCALSDGQKSLKLEAQRVHPPAAEEHPLAANQFTKGRYRLIIPDHLDGIVKIQLSGFLAPPVLISVSTQPQPEKPTISQSLEKDEAKDPSLEELFTLYQPYLANISAYEPMYFLVGVEPEKSKFQISLKYLFFDAESELRKKHPWLQGLHFGYTQTSFWDLESNSAPFEDTSYKPEFFYLTPNLSFRPQAMKGLFIQTGARHESNGRGGDDSRSTNKLYLKPVMVFYDAHSRLGLKVAPKLQVYVGNDDDTNRDLPDYRGYFELDLKAGKAESLVVGSILRLAEEGASIQVDLTYPLHRLSSKSAGIYFQAQYVDALAESLLHYQERTRALRFGFAIVR